MTLRDLVNYANENEEIMNAELWYFNGEYDNDPLPIRSAFFRKEMLGSETFVFSSDELEED